MNWFASIEKKLNLLLAQPPAGDAEETTSLAIKAQTGKLPAAPADNAEVETYPQCRERS